MEEPINQEAAKIGSYASPMQQYGSAILNMTNPENEIEKMVLALKSQDINDAGNVVQIGQPLMNHEGVSKMKSMVQSFVNQVTVMSNLNEKEIPKLMDFLGDTLSKDLMTKKQFYDVKDSTDADVIYFIVMGTAFVTLKRAYMEGDRRFWKNSTVEINQRSESIGNKPAGVLSSVLGWANKR